MPRLNDVLILIFACSLTVVNAQVIAPLTRADSINVLNALAAEKTKTEPDAAGKLAQRALALAESVGDLQGKARSLYLLASAQKNSNLAHDAIRNYLASAKLYESFGDSLAAGRCYHFTATIYIFRLSNYTRAYQYCSKAVSLLRGDSLYLPSALSNQASLYLQTKKYDEALAIYRQSYDDYRKNGNARAMCIALNNMATALELKGDNHESLAYYEKALDIAREMQDTRTIAHIIVGMSPVKCKIGDHTEAMQLAEQALAMAKEHRFPDTQIAALCLLSGEEGHKGRLKSARDHLLEAEKLCVDFNLPGFKREIYEPLSHLFHKLGEHEMAIKYRTKYTQFVDSVANQERLAVADIANERSQVILDKQGLKQASIPVNAGAVATGLVLVLAGVGFVFQRMRVEKQSDLNVAQGKMEEPEIADIQGAPPLVAGTDENRHLEVLHGEGVKLLALRDIWWFEKEGKLYQAIAEGKQYRVRQNITELEELLQNTNFFRINRSVIINMDEMHNYSFWEHHKYIIRMKDANKTEFVISRNRLKEMKETFQVIEAS